MTPGTAAAAIPLPVIALRDVTVVFPESVGLEIGRAHV
jgi:hypothetical protein